MQISVMPKIFLLFLVATSIFGLVLILFISLSPNLQPDSFPFRRSLISALYSAVCILGIVTVFYPEKCSLIAQKSFTSLNIDKPISPAIRIKAHHPNCEKYSPNRITINSSALCAACSGLLIGSITSIITIIMFAFGFFDSMVRSPWLLIVGEILMLVGLAQIKMVGYLKMTANALFVIGSCLSLVVSDLISQNLLLDTYMLGLIVFLLWFRIYLSELNNKRTCFTCGYCFRLG